VKIRRAVQLVIGVVLLAFAAALVFADSERGHRLLLAQAASALPGLRVGRVEGSLFRELTFTDVTLADRFGNEALRAGTLRLRLDLKALLQKRVVVEALAVDGLILRAR
jgi:autotransporter translocation and assembly factor TamB